MKIHINNDKVLSNLISENTNLIFSYLFHFDYVMLFISNICTFCPYLHFRFWTPTYILYFISYCSSITTLICFTPIIYFKHSIYNDNIMFYSFISHYDPLLSSLSNSWVRIHPNSYSLDFAAAFCFHSRVALSVSLALYSSVGTCLIRTLIPRSEYYWSVAYFVIRTPFCYHNCAPSCQLISFIIKIKIYTCKNIYYQFSKDNSLIKFTFSSANDRSNSYFIFICYKNYFFRCLNTRSTVLLKYLPVSRARESLLFLLLFISDFALESFWQDFAFCSKLSTTLLLESAIMRAYCSYYFNSL